MRNQFRRTCSAVLALLMLVAMLVGCSGKSDAPVQNTTGNPATATGAGTNTTTPGAKQGGKLVSSIGNNPTEFFDPYKQGNLNTYGWAVYEPLAYDQAKNVYEPCLAESWELDKDTNTMILHIRHGVTFSNGDTLDADDVVFSLTCRKEYGTYGLIGSPSVVEKVDDYTVKIVWDEFSLNFETWILPQYIYSKETFEEKGLDWMLNNMVGTGPYVMDEYIPDVRLSFVRNDSYWREEKPAPDSIEWVVISDTTANLAAFLGGEIDYVDHISDPVQIAQLKEAGYEPVQPPVGAGIQEIAMPISNNPDDPLANKDVRVALFKYGVNWEDMGKTINGPDATHTNAIGYTMLPYYDESLEKSSYDVEKAKQMLADAGYENGFETTIYCTDRGAANATYLQDAFSKLNITCNVEVADYTQINGEYIAGKAATSGIVLSGWMFWSSNQIDILSKFLSPDGVVNGITAFTDEQKEIWNKVVTATSLEEQNQYLYQFVDSYVNDTAMIWPSFNVTQYMFYQPWCHYEDAAYCAMAGRNPMHIWVDER